MRDKGLNQLTKLLVREQRWVSVDHENPHQQQKHLRVAWEGLFFSKSQAIANQIMFDVD